MNDGHIHPLNSPFLQALFLPSHRNLRFQIIALLAVNLTLALCLIRNPLHRPPAPPPVLTISSLDFTSHLHGGILAAQKKEAEKKAEGEFQKFLDAVKANPEDPGAEWNLAQEYRNHGKLSPAIEHYEACLQKHETRKKKQQQEFDSHYLLAGLALADAYRTKNDFKKSLECYQKIRTEAERLNQWRYLVSSLEGSARLALDLGNVGAGATFYQAAIQMAQKSRQPTLQVSPWFRYANYLRSQAKEPRLAYAAYLTAEGFIPENAPKSEADLIRKTRMDLEKTIPKEAKVVTKEIASYRQKALEFKYSPPAPPPPKGKS